MSSLQEFIDDLASVDKYEDRLKYHAIFIAGIGACKSGEKPETLLKYLACTQKMHDEGYLSNTNKTIIEYHFYKGEFKEAKKLLRGYKSSSVAISQEVQPESNSTMNIDSNKTEPELKESKQSIKPANKTQSNNTYVKTMKPEELRECELEIFSLINMLRKVDEKESLRLRKVEEQKRLQAEYDAKELKQKLELEYQEKLKQELEERKRQEIEALKCIVCKEVIKPSELFMLEACAHTLHKKCAKEFILKQIDEKKFPIVCTSCKSEFGIPEIKSFTTARQFQKYEDLGFKMYLEKNTENYNSCPTSTCTYMFELEDDVKLLECPLCKRSYCFNCRSISHKGTPCGGMFRNIQIYGVLKGQKIKSCPICNFWVEKKDNSNVLQCRCGTFFCFACGANGARCGC
jgi:IBR domain, a half RING-finger domain